MGHESDPDLHEQGSGMAVRDHDGVAVHRVKEISESLIGYHEAIARQCRQDVADVDDRSRHRLQVLADREESVAGAIRDASARLSEGESAAFVRFADPASLPRIASAADGDGGVDGFLRRVIEADRKVEELCKSLVRATASREVTRLFEQIVDLERTRAKERVLSKNFNQDL